MNLHRRLREHTGMVLSAATVERAARERMMRLGLRSPLDYAPGDGSAEFEAMVDLVTVPESWMFRDPYVFDTALRFVQRRLLRHPGRQVAVLSLPCAGGEEPYSMAMTLARAGIPPALCRIDAVDLSHAALERARLGRYTRNAFRGADLAFRERWFRRDGAEHVIDDALRHYVRFSQGNLLRAAELQHEGRRYDLVFCRNLLIYFDDAGRAAAAAAVHALLHDDGLLLSGFAEAPAFCRAGFAPPSLRHAYALRKEGVAAAAPAARPAPVQARVQMHAQTNVQPGAQPSQQLNLQLDALLADAQRLADGGRLAEASQACREALLLRPGLPQAWFLLALISDCAGQPLAAEDQLRRCLYLQPEHYEALCSLALLHEQRGDGAAAARLRERAARVHARAVGAGVPE